MLMRIFLVMKIGSTVVRAVILSLRQQDLSHQKKLGFVATATLKRSTDVRAVMIYLRQQDLSHQKRLGSVATATLKQ